MGNKIFIGFCTTILLCGNALAKENVKTIFPGILFNSVIDNQINHTSIDGDTDWAFGINGFGNSANLRGTKNGESWTAQTVGTTVSGLLYITPNLIVGAGYVYGITDIPSGHIDSHTGFIYSRYQHGEVYARGMFSYGVSNYSNTDVKNLGVQAFFGKEIMSHITFEVGGRYINFDSGEKSDLLTAVGNVEYKRNFVVGTAITMAPKVNFGISSDVAKNSDLEPCGLNTGVGVDMQYHNFGIVLDYDFEVRHNYIEHTGYLKFKYIL